jgi:HSP20 family protein
MPKASSSLHFIKHPQSGDGPGASWTPNTDVYVTDDCLVIKVELAGMRREDLELVVEDNRVKISGTRPDGCRAPRCKFLAMEINYGPFETVLELPRGYDLRKAKAAYQNGFLRIDIPLKKPEPSLNLTVPISSNEE